MYALLNSMENRPHIIAITEVKGKIIKNSVMLSELNLEGYQCFCAGLEDSAARGVLIYVDDRINADLVDMPTTAFKECLFVKVHYSNDAKFILGNIYRSPSSTDKNDEELCKLIKYVAKQYSPTPVLLVGDFNFPRIRWGSEMKSYRGLTQSEIHFIKVIRENLFTQHIYEPTRQRGKDTPHILDLVISSDDLVDEIEFMSPLGMSDHAVISFSCRLKAKLQNELPYGYRWDKGDYTRA